MATTITNRQVLINGAVYETAGLAVIETNGTTIAIKPLHDDWTEHKEAVNVCKHCGRYDVAPVVYRSIQDAIDAAFLIPVNGR